MFGSSNVPIAIAKIAFQNTIKATQFAINVSYHYLVKSLFLGGETPPLRAY